MNPILAVGSVAFDSIKTPFGEANRVVGGAATYFAIAASFFTEVRIVAVVGDDFGGNVEKVFGGRRIDLTGLERVPGETFRWKGEYGFDLNSRETIYTHLNVFEKFTPKIPAAHITSPFVFLGNIHPTLQIDVLNQVQKPTLVGADTMNYWIERTPDELKQVLKRVDVLLINDSEARELAGEANLVKAARKVQAMGPKTLVIKRGEHGVLMTRSGGGFFAAPAMPLEEVFDPTGRGRHICGRISRVSRLVRRRRRRRAGPGHHLREHAGVICRRGLQRRSAAAAEARRGRRALQRVQEADALRRGVT